MNPLKALVFAAALLTGSIALANPDPESAKEAEKLLDVIGLQATLDLAMAQMINAQLQKNPAFVPYKEVMFEFFKKYMSYESLKPEMVKAYSEAFTTAELKELNAFYSSAVGQKAVQQIPKLMAQTAQIGVTRVRDNMGELQAVIKAGTETEHAPNLPQQ